MFSIWYTLELDLFATRHNHKLAAFVSPVPDCQVVAVDTVPFHGKVSVHFSSDCHDAVGGLQATALVQVPNGVGSAFAILLIVAFHSAEIVSGLPSGNPSSGPAVAPARVRHFPQPAGMIASIQVELIKRGLKEQ